MRKRITSALLTLVMLLSLVPAMGTTAAAASESHPVKVGQLKESKEMCVSYRYNDLTYSAYFSDEKEGITGSTPDEKWEQLKKISTWTTTSHGTCKVVGWSYYDPDSGRFYHKGSVYAKTDFVYQASTTEDTLTFIVDSNLTAANGLYSKSEDTGLKNLNIELRNGATLTINGGVWKSRGDYQTAAALDVTRTKKMSGWLDYNRTVYDYGDLTLTGSGTLKINVPDEEYVLYGIRAGNISIYNDVSLDIQTIGNYFLFDGTKVESAAIYSNGNVNIDTTGAVNIVCQKAPSKPNASDRGSYNAFAHTASINLTNAQSVTLNVVKKEDTFDLGNGSYREDWYNNIVSSVRSNGWTVTEDLADASPYTVTMTPQAMPTAAQLTVGDNAPVQSNVTIPNVTVTGGEYVSLKASVTLPTWLSNMLTGSNARAKVGDWFLRIFEGQKLVGETIGGYSNSINVNELPEVSIETTGFKPVAGKTYTVYACIPIVTKDGGKQLGSASVIATIKAVAKPDEVISSVTLTGDALTEGVDSGPDLRKADSGTGYTFTQSPWSPSGSIAAGKEYYTTLTLTATDGYVFPTDWEQLRSIISVKLGDTAITKLGLGLANGGKTLSLTVYATADHMHNWSGWKYDEDCHYKECTTCKTVSFKDEHSWGNWMNDGEDKAKRTCSTCGYEETRAATGRPISFLKINIIRPVAGVVSAASDLTIREGYTDQVEIVPNSVGWYNESGNPVTGNFEKGKSYTIKAQFKPKGELTFADTITTAGLFFTDDETKTLSEDNKTVDYSCTFTAYESTTVNTALPTLKVGEAMPLPTVPDGRTYTVNILYSAGAGSLLSLSYDSTERTWKDSSNAEVTGDDLKVKADTVYVYSYTIKEEDNEKVTANLTGTGNSVTSDATGNWVTASYDTSSMNKITSVDLTVTAPEYGKTPATTAAGADGAKYTVGTPTWTDNDTTFGAKAYTVTIPVTAADGYTFAAGCVYTVNGYSATYADGKVSYTFPALTAPHTHTYGAWAKLDDSYHSRTCNAGDDIQVEAHTWGNWATVDGNTHKRTCNDCGAEQTANHNWVFDSQVDATFTAPGKTVYKCDDNCGVANKEEPIAQLVKIDVENLTVAKPVKDVAAAEATTTDNAYYVAATEWVAADGTVLDITKGDKFQPGTVYTVKITLETAGDGVFSANSTYSIDGKTATVSPALTGDGYTDTVILTYTFDATEGAYVPTAPSISTATLPDGKVGEEYNQLLSANGSAPITWSVESGNLPDGLTLNSANGTISGTPSKAGDFKFTVKATNDGGSDTKELTIKITDTEAAKYHNVTITGAGTGATGAGSHAAGTTVNIYAGTKSGYTFDGWTSDDVIILSASSKNASFVMPDKAVTVKANWTYNGGGSGGGGYTYYTIKATAGVNGSISPSGNVSVREGRDQTFTITPDKGYAVARVLIDSKNIGAVKSYTFENVKKNHTIEVVFMKAGGNPQTGVFVDVPEDSYYEEAVNWAVENGITTGTDATHFTPDGICTRAQAVTFLWRSAGSPAPKSTTMPFTDVKTGSYYYDAVLWAVENGITKGTSATEFSPAQNCSRAQIVTFLWRSEKSPAAGTVNPFTDVKSDAYYADAVLWAVKEDVTKGTTATTFSPNANCTRAQIVTFIWRALAE